MKIPTLTKLGLTPLILLGSLLLATQPAKATETSLQATGDVTLLLGAPDKNHGSATSLWVQQGNHTSLLRFDLSGIAASELTSVTLGVYFEAAPQVTTASLKIFVRSIAPLNTTWVEGTGGIYPGGSTEAGASTWNSLHHGSDSWAEGTGGALGVPNTVLGSFTLSRTAAADASPGYREVTITDAATLAQWLEAGQVDLLISGAIASGTGPLRAEFTSREGTITQRPYLSVNYEAIPETGTVAMVGIGLVVVLGACKRTRKSGNL